MTDEEAYSAGAHAVIDSGIRADACIVTESSFTKAVIGAPGKILVRVRAIGRAAHGFFPWEGINAAIELARFVAAVCDAVPAGTHPRIPSSQTVLSFHSGSTQYVITLPEIAEALLTRQIVPGEREEHILAQLRAFADSLESPARFELSVEPPYYPPYELDVATAPLAHAFTAATTEVLGAAVPFGYSAGVSDANLFSGAGIPSIHFGPLAGDFHQATEWVDLTTLVPCARVVLAMAARILA